jgi:hypothetical protein
MESQTLDRIATLLQVIADELYVARTDREFEGASREQIEGQGPTGPEMWDREGRDYMIRGIEKMRDSVEKAA